MSINSFKKQFIESTNLPRSQLILDDEFDFSTFENDSINALILNPDKSIMFLGDGFTIKEFSLSLPGKVASAKFTGNQFSHGALNSINGLEFDDTGTLLYAVSPALNRRISRIHLSKPYSLSETVTLEESNIDPAFICTSAKFYDNGNKVLISGDNSLKRFSVTIPYFISGTTLVDDIDSFAVNNPKGLSLDNSARNIYYVSDSNTYAHVYGVKSNIAASSQSGTVTLDDSIAKYNDIYISGNGKVAYILDTGKNRIITTSLSILLPLQ